MSTARRRVLHHHGRRERDHHDRGDRPGAAGRGLAEGVAGAGGGAVRLLPVRPDHVGGGAAEGRRSRRMTTSTPPCRAMSADAAPISASALRSSTLREFEIMDGLILREQIADETAMSRRRLSSGRPRPSSSPTSSSNPTNDYG